LQTFAQYASEHPAIAHLKLPLLKLRD
jgi:hypothetical protein